MKRESKRILVTGSAGFIGSHVFDDLVALGHEVWGLDDLSGGFLRNVSNKERFFKVDLRDREATHKAVKEVKPEIIFHLAADATEGRSQFTPLSATDRNYVAYMNLLVPAIEYGLQKMVLASSMSVYGEQQVPFKETQNPYPESPYGVAKHAMERVTKALSKTYGFSYVIIRPHNVYGPKQNLSDPYRNVIGIFMNQLLKGKPYYIYGGDQKRAYSHIDDVAPPMIKAAFKKSCEGKTFNLGSDKPVTLNALSDTLLKVFFGKNIPKHLLPKHLPGRPYEVRYAYCSHGEAKKYLGFSPKISLEEGIRDMLSWARKIGPQEFVYLDSLELRHDLVPKPWKEKLY